MDGQTLQAWIDYIFDHPVGDPAWYWAEDAPEWQGSREEIPSLIAENFERGGELLARFSDEQLDQGFWFLVGNTPPDFTLTLVDDTIPLEERLRALRSFVPLFEQVMVPRCSSNLSHCEEGKPLNRSCYMWWDLLWYNWVLPLPDEDPRELKPAQFNTEVRYTLRRLLALEHDACRESALHGIGHWSSRYPNCDPQLAEIVDEFLAKVSDLRPELIEYAKNARIGKVL